jgi:hypothetical protein
MKLIKTAITATVMLAACLNTRLLAADTNLAAALATQPTQPKISSPAIGQSLSHGWYGPGYDGGTGYYNPAVSGEYNPYPFYNIVGGESLGTLYGYSLPNQNESPYNPQAALTRHGLGLPSQLQPMSNVKKKAAQPAEPPSAPDGH